MIWNSSFEASCRPGSFTTYGFLFRNFSPSLDVRRSYFDLTTQARMKHAPMLVCKLREKYGRCYVIPYFTPEQNTYLLLFQAAVPL
jgi:hypothetical protein